MENALKEEYKHFGMDLEFLLRRTPAWRKELKTILFSKGDIVARGEQAEDAVIDRSVCLPFRAQAESRRIETSDRIPSPLARAVEGMRFGPTP